MESPIYCLRPIANFGNPFNINMDEKNDDATN
jgi:hypothetical protein